MLARLLVAATELHRALRLFRPVLSCVSYAAFGSNAWYRPKVFRLSGGCSAFELHWNWLARMDSHHEFRINNPA
jgi:hypothetical protein